MGDPSNPNPVFKKTENSISNTGIGIGSSIASASDAQFTLPIADQAVLKYSTFLQKWTNGVDNEGVGGGPTPNLNEVLTTGNDGGGLKILNIGTPGVGENTAATPKSYVDAEVSSATTIANDALLATQVLTVDVQTAQTTANGAQTAADNAFTAAGDALTTATDAFTTANTAATTAGTALTTANNAAAAAAQALVDANAYTDTQIAAIPAKPLDEILAAGNSAGNQKILDLATPDVGDTSAAVPKSYVDAISLASLITANAGNIDASTKKIINVVNPTLDQDAATKKYVDDGLSAVTLASLITTNAGDIDASTKKIINVVDPTSDQDAATKKYVDDVTLASLITANVGDIDASTKKIINVVDPTADQHAATKKYVDDGVSAVTLASLITANAGDIDASTKKIINVVDPTADQHAATKKYVDDEIANVGTPTLASLITANAGDIDASTKKIINVVDPTNPQDAATMAYVDALIPAPSALATNDGAGASGGSASATGVNATAIGSTAVANGIGSTALGAGSYAAAGAVGIGPGGNASAPFCVVMGYVPPDLSQADGNALSQNIVVLGQINGSQGIRINPGHSQFLNGALYSARRGVRNAGGRYAIWLDESNELMAIDLPLVRTGEANTNSPSCATTHLLLPLSASNYADYPSWGASWDASTNTPTLADGVGTLDDAYRVSVEGTTTIDGISNWYVGDYIYFNGTTWDKRARVLPYYFDQEVVYFDPMGTKNHIFIAQFGLNSPWQPTYNGTRQTWNQQLQTGTGSMEFKICTRQELFVHLVGHDELVAPPWISVFEAVSQFVDAPGGASFDTIHIGAGGGIANIFFFTAPSSFERVVLLPSSINCTLINQY